MHAHSCGQNAADPWLQHPQNYQNRLGVPQTLITSHAKAMMANHFLLIGSLLMVFLVAISLLCHEQYPEKAFLLS